MSPLILKFGITKWRINIVEISMRSFNSLRLLLQFPQISQIPRNTQMPLEVQRADTLMDVIGKLLCCNADRRNRPVYEIM